MREVNGRANKGRDLEKESRLSAATFVYESPGAEISLHLFLDLYLEPQAQTAPSQDFHSALFILTYY